MVQPDKEPDKELDMLNHVQLINPKGSGFIDKTECISFGTCQLTAVQKTRCLP